MNANRSLKRQEMEMIPEELPVNIEIRSYRPPDGSAIVGLLRNGEVYGHAAADCEIVLRAMADAALASRHHVWVAESDSQVIAAIAVARHQDQIAHLLWICFAADLEHERHVAEQLVGAAMTHVWEQGCLKLVVHTPLAAPQVTGFFHHLGFTFSRERGAGGAHVLEFYLDLYVRPHPRESRIWAARRQPE
jgi:N-acetylglutamate synthase-like GNAT family acetyltransferase